MRPGLRQEESRSRPKEVKTKTRLRHDTLSIMQDQDETKKVEKNAKRDRDSSLKTLLQGIIIATLIQCQYCYYNFVTRCVAISYNSVGKRVNIICVEEFNQRICTNELKLDNCFLYCFHYFYYCILILLVFLLIYFDSTIQYVL